MEKEKKRCSWCNVNNPIYTAYHDNEWGIFPSNEHDLYELFILETFQAGLSWECVLNKRGNFRRAWDNFDIDKVSLYDEKKIEEQMKDPSIIRNRKKIEASVRNSRVFKSIQNEFGSFSSYLKSFTKGITSVEEDPAITRSPLSDSISSDLKKRGMSFVGSTTIYSFLQAVGIISSHEKSCFLYSGNHRFLIP